MSEHPSIQTSGHHGRAIDQAIDLLGAVLRLEAEDAASRRKDVLRGRLAGSSQSALRSRGHTPAETPQA